MTTDQIPTESLQLTDYIRVIGRRRSIVVAGAVIGALMAWLFVMYTGPTYVATASILVNPVNVNVGTATARLDQLVNLPTERERIFSADITQRAAAIMQYEGPPAGLVERLSVIIPEGTQILELSFRASQPEPAQAGAQAFADAYLEHRGEQADRLVERRREQLQQELAEVSTSLTDANRRLVNAEVGSLEHALAEADIQLLTARTRDLQQELADIELISVDPGEVIAPARLPTNPASQPAWLVVMVGALTGMVFSLPVAFGRERLDDRIRDSRDLAALGVGPVLGSVDVPAPRRGESLSVQEDRSAAATYRRLSLNIISALSMSGGTRIAVTGVGIADDDPELAIQVAISTAAMRYPVLLIEADASAELSERLRVREMPRLEEVVAGNKTFGQVVQIVDALPDLRVVVGGIPSSVRVPWDRLSDLIHQLPSATDYLMVHTSPALESVDTLKLCALMDAVVLVVRRGRTTRDAVTQAANQLEKGGAKIAGVVLVEGRDRRRRSREGSRDNVS